MPYKMAKVVSLPAKKLKMPAQALNLKQMRPLLSMFFNLVSDCSAHAYSQLTQACQHSTHSKRFVIFKGKLHCIYSCDLAFPLCKLHVILDLVIDIRTSKQHQKLIISGASDACFAFALSYSILS
jgi:hypothetical protein